MEKLAMHGGGAASGRLLGYGRQTIDEDDVAAVADVLRSDFLTCGPATERFERAVAEAAGARYATAVANGTAALEFAREVLLALQVAPEPKITEWYDFHKKGYYGAPLPQDATSWEEVV